MVGWITNKCVVEQSCIRLLVIDMSLQNLSTTNSAKHKLLIALFCLEQVQVITSTRHPLDRLLVPYRDTSLHLTTPAVSRNPRLETEAQGSLPFHIVWV